MAGGRLLYLTPPTSRRKDSSNERRVPPVKLTLNFGEEFAHTDCLAGQSKG